MFLAVCDIPVVVYYGPNGINYTVTIDNVITSGNVVADNVAEMSYDTFSRRLFYYDNSGTFYSMEVDGADIRQIASVSNVDRFTVDGRNNVTYYRNEFTNTVHSLNLTNLATTDLGITARDIDMDSINK